jgi:glycosyltransferase involved in cell wall biosynthesis
MAYLSNGMVSIIVVAGGKSPILAECLESVARQKQSLREVIVVDNTGTAALSFHYSHLLGAARWITP